MAGAYGGKVEAYTQWCVPNNRKRYDHEQQENLPEVC
jgi:hypothetical protein